ncbi:MAG: aminodeoxychorismate synthase component I [Chthoniobacteraceae bacterium]|nr:aminodeoxychorismate synthase component I [Chthoniobacteraceae bacterium]
MNGVCNLSGLAPAEAAARCRALPGLVFFDTATVAEDENALSLLAAEPSLVLTGRTHADWEVLREAVASRQRPAASPEGIPPGFAAGWVEYDGAFCFGFYDAVLAYRHADAAWIAAGNGTPAWADMLTRRCDTTSTCPLPRIAFAPPMARADFIARVERAQAYIAAGDIYQVNLTHRFSVPWPGNADPFALYEALRRCSPAPHAAYLALNERRVLSSSPELFLKIDGRRICTRPIKGTRPRRADPEEDVRSARDLTSSPKERAELLMITDLERNDLGQICAYGSVRAPELLKLERFAQVFHLVSTVEGELRPKVDAVTALRACSPGGSITGAPKKRAMEIIAELEPEPRGLYTGAIGYFGFDGSAQFNIAIRTVVVEKGLAHFHVGGGIVADSLPEKEWQETLDKAAGILLAAEQMR